METNGERGPEREPEAPGAPIERYAHFSALQKSSRYLPMEELSDGWLYLIHARNSHLGIWESSQKAFILWREKFGRHYLFREYHWDIGGPHGTAKPFVRLEGPIAPELHEETLIAKLGSLSYAASMVLTRPFID